jgi:type 1 glutamine amidotransferase
MILMAIVACGIWALAQAPTTNAPAAGARGQGAAAAPARGGGQEAGAPARGAGGQDAAAAAGQARGGGGRGGGAGARKRILAWTDTRNGQAQHESVGHIMAVFERIGYETGLWDTLIRTDSNIISKTAKKTDGSNASGGPSLSNVDAIFFQGHREVPIDASQKAELLEFVKSGKGFIMCHVGLTAFESWPEWPEISGGRFAGHSISGAQTVINESPTSPFTKQFGASFPMSDEWYLPKDYDRTKIDVLLRLNVAPDDSRAAPGGDYPLAWTMMCGQGRVFWGTFGHANEIWDNRNVQQFFFEGTKWALGMTDYKVEPHAMRGTSSTPPPAAPAAGQQGGPGGQRGGQPGAGAQQGGQRGGQQPEGQTPVKK